MSENVVDAMGAFIPGSAIARPPAPMSPDLTDGLGARERQFENRISDQIARTRRDNTSLLGGTVELVGLDDVRRALGPTWAEASSRVGELAQVEIDRRLGGDDFYRAYGTESFLICFVGIDKIEAERRAAQIAAAIKDTLRAAFPSIAQEISPEPFVAELEPQWLSARGQGSLVEQLVHNLLELRREHERGMSRFRSPMLRRSKLLFSPAWHASKQVVAFNHCALDVWKSRSRRLFHSEYPLAESQRLTAEVDFITLSRSIRALYMLLKLGRAAPLLIPVRFSTITNPKSAPAYQRLLETMRPDHKSLFAIEIRDLPSGEDPAMAIEKIAHVLPWVRWLALAVDLRHSRLAEFADPRIWALSVDLSGYKSTDPALRPLLADLHHAAMGAELNTIAHGANSIGLALAAAESGITYVDGAAIHPATLEPRPPSPLHPVLSILPQNRASRYLS
ncbi:hypothetical protein [Pelagibacterium luteolum]|uniref:EAL domain, c-di-GMP-specific phosphodiesterase class I (Or its enzymatically inactive variant) n=1 Tax=Pelagibacterium luteolum TaxID=440168 RepID=A0A1G7U2Y2_9HYPH|nr:hypothetical protein [Pelagibacterium luteolum]SDG41916.1 hypothetical protein SAMN04487974_102516 [Pelagibacterium luteolum]